MGHSIVQGGMPVTPPLAQLPAAYNSVYCVRFAQVCARVNLGHDRRLNSESACEAWFVLGHGAVRLEEERSLPGVANKPWGECVCVCVCVCVCREYLTCRRRPPVVRGAWCVGRGAR